MDSQFWHKECEEKIYTMWRSKKEFSPQYDKLKETFSMVMPPPNVTGILHMGHALNNSLQDVIVRYHRMKGMAVLWLPGTDHAGIATQNVVERQLNNEGLGRHDIGREKFLERTWLVKENHHNIIKSQLEKMGCSCDWEHERFTMDEGASRAVREAFVTLYEKGLIYKGKYLVNYCYKCGTALSDDEVEYDSIQGKLYHVRYPYADGLGYITVATTRPETMFGDVAVAVHPEDKRYKNIVGTILCIPLTDRKIPIIADSFVDREFGTGMVKITPAHDTNDWECGIRNNLEMVNILNPDGTLNGNCPQKYRGILASDARDIIVKDLEEGGFITEINDHVHDVGHCYRCHTVIEPYLSDQWFVKMKGLAKKALGALKRNDIVFYPRRWENTYCHWLETIRDWCISRQLWWGHRIPVWYCKDCGKVIVSREDPSCCPKCHKTNLLQDNDVLDTWFSSWLWPFSTLGWPDKTADLDNFFPTSTLVSAYDIIFFWISRMIMSSKEFLGKVPFRDIVITGLVRDIKGRKMAKSLGNGIDPNEIIDQYGADAMKFTLCYVTTLGQDLLIEKNLFNLGSRFTNKIWNAARFLLLNLEGRNIRTIDESEYSIMDRWIYGRFNYACQKISYSIENYKFSDAAQCIYSFFWNDFCDWYIESSKQKLLHGTKEEKDKAISILMDMLEASMRLMHPFLSFITEEIYQKLPNHMGDVIVAQYPIFDKTRCYDDAHILVTSLQDVVRTVRVVRNNLQIAPDKKLKVVFRPSEVFLASDLIESEKGFISSLIGASIFIVDKESTQPINGAFPVNGLGYECFVFVREAINVDSEIERLKADTVKAKKALSLVEAKLANQSFIMNARQAAIEKEQAKRKEFLEEIRKNNIHIELLSSF